jgi:NCS1 family nucleobase:cation symporter-1
MFKSALLTIKHILHCIALLCCSPAYAQGGYNIAALVAVVAGVLPCLPGLLASVGLTGSAGPVFSAIYDCAWFVGVAVSTVVYCGCMGYSSSRAAGGPDDRPGLASG